MVEGCGIGSDVTVSCRKGRACWKRAVGSVETVQLVVGRAGPVGKELWDRFRRYS